MKAHYYLLGLAALAFAACNPTTPDTPDVKSELTVSGATNNAVSVPAEGKTVSLTVKASVSWTASCDAEWISIDPQSNTNEGNETVTTKVNVTVAANNAEEARTASLTIAAEGLDPVVIAVNQAAVSAEPKYINVWDMAEWEAVENPTVELDYTGTAVSLVINAAGDWTATYPEWITLSPDSNVYDGENDNVTVTVSASLAEAARSGEITFTGDFENTLVVAVNQKASVTFAFEDIEVAHTYCDASVKVIPSDGEIHWRAVYAETSLGLTEDYAAAYIVNTLNNFLSSNTPEAVLAGATVQGEETLDYTELDPATDYTVYVVAVAYDAAAGAFVQASLPASHGFSTTAAPEVSEDYLALLGTYVCDVYDYFGDERVQLTMVVESKYINEEYDVYFPDNLITPVYQTYVDRFPALYDEATKSLHLLNGTIGSEDATWNFGMGFDCAMALVMFYEPIDEDDDIEVPTIEYLPYVLSADGNSLVLNAEVPENTELWYEGLIVDDTYTSTGYAYGIMQFDQTTTFTRVQEPAALSVKANVLEPNNFRMHSAKIDKYYPAIR